MKLAVPRTRPLVEAGAASLSDIIMNLFIFFFIAFSLLATFEKQKQQATEERLHDLELPASAGGAAGSEQRAVVVDLGKDGEARIDGEPVVAAELTSRLRQLLGTERSSVVVRADRALSLGSTVAQLDRIWAAGPAGVSLATAAQNADRGALGEAPH